MLVLLSRLIAPEPLTLSFSRVEIGALFLGVLIGAHVAGDGRANWFKGVQLVAFYLILAAMFYLIPADPRERDHLRDAVRRSSPAAFACCCWRCSWPSGAPRWPSGTRAERLVNATLLALVLVAAVLDLRERGRRWRFAGLAAGIILLSVVDLNVRIRYLAVTGGRDDAWPVRRARGLAGVHRRDAPATAGGDRIVGAICVYAA